jgi:hypothetical protein
VNDIIILPRRNQDKGQDLGPTPVNASLNQESEVSGSQNIEKLKGKCKLSVKVFRRFSLGIETRMPPVIVTIIGGETKMTGGIASHLVTNTTAPVAVTESTPTLTETPTNIPIRKVIETPIETTIETQGEIRVAIHHPAQCSPTNDISYHQTLSRALKANTLQTWSQNLLKCSLQPHNSQCHCSCSKAMQS